MKRANQLTQLIWDFWREDRQEFRKLILLEDCKVSRWWGVLHIHCSEKVDNNLVAVFSVNSSKKMVVEQ